MYFVKCYGPIEVVNCLWACPKLKPLPQRFENENAYDINKCFVEIRENVGVNRAPVRIRHSGRTGDSSRHIFEKENLNKKVNKKN